MFKEMFPEQFFKLLKGVGFSELNWKVVVDLWTHKTERLPRLFCFVAGKSYQTSKSSLFLSCTAVTQNSLESSRKYNRLNTYAQVYMP